MARFRSRRRRRTRQWFPVLGTETHITGGTAKNDVAWQEGSETIIGNDPVTVVVALTWDFQAEEEVELNTGFPTLADFEQSAWFLDGIVGKVFFGSFPDPELPAGFGPIAITAGFEVLRVDSASGAPIATGADIETSYDPQLAFNIRDPWIWRRTWIIEPSVSDTGLIFSQRQWPATNVNYGSAVDGPHIETKSKRKIAQEERLFFIFTARHFPVGADLSLRHTGLNWMLDYRLIGRSLKATNRRNASR